MRNPYLLPISATDCLQGQGSMKGLRLFTGIGIAWAGVGWGIAVLAQQIPAAPPQNLLPADSPITILDGDVQLDVQFDFAGSGTLPLAGKVDLSAVAVRVEGLAFPLTNIYGTVLALSGGEQISIPALEANYSQIPIVITGDLGLGEGEASGLNLQIQIPRVSASQLQQGFDLSLPVAVAGEFQANLQVTGTVDDPQIRGDVRSLGAGQIDAVSLSDLQAQFAVRNQQVQIEPIQLQLADGQVQGAAWIQLGSELSAQANFDLQGLDLDSLASRYRVEAPYPLGQLDAQVQVSAPQLEPSGTARWQFRGGDLQGTGQIAYRDGIVTLPQTQIRVGQNQGQVDLRGRWARGLAEAEVTAQGVDLSFFLPELIGLAAAQISVTGRTKQLSLAGLNVQGSVSLPQGIQGLWGEQRLGISEPITAQLGWNGSTLQLDPVQLGKLGQAQGQIAIDPETLQIGVVALALNIPEFDLQQIELPSSLGVVGRVGLTAQVQGPFLSPDVTGQLALVGFETAGLAFADLQGPFSWQPTTSGGHIDLQPVIPGNRDQITAELSPDLQQITISIQQALTELRGSRLEDDIQIGIAQFPLQTIGSLAGHPEALEGDLSAELSVDIGSQTAQGQIGLEAPRLTQIQADGVEVDFTYRDGVLGIAEADLQLFDSLYQATGTVTVPMLATLFDQTSGEDLNRTTASFIPSTPTSPEYSMPQLDLQVSTSNGRLQDIVSTLKWETWEDVSRRGLMLPSTGPAQLLNPTETQGAPREPLLAQIRRYVQVLQQQFEAESAKPVSPLPPPTSVQGEFSTQVRISGSLADPSVELQFEGRNWQAEEFQIHSAIATGHYQNGTLTLEPLTLSTDDRNATFSGQLGLEQQAGELQIVNLPLEIFQRFLPEAVSISGNFNSQIELRGNLRDPQLQGSFAVVETRVNDVPIQEASGQIGYDAGLWNTDSRILVTQDDQPVLIAGTIPYTLPIAEVQAVSDQIDLDIKVEDQALRLINAFTDQVTWQEGESQIDVRVKGTLQDPSIQGDLILSSGVVQVAALADPIRDLTGRIDFNTSLLEVPELSAQVGEGIVTSSGQLPINSRGAFGQRGEFQPLTLQFDQVDLKVPGRYQGKLDGALQVGGILTRPLLGGQMVVSNGAVEVGPGEERSTDPPDSTDPVQPPDRFDITGVEAFQDPLLTSRARFSLESSDQQNSLVPLQLRDLQVGLGENITVGYGDLFSFSAQGDLTIGGDLNTLQPDGTIVLRQGGINLPIGGGFRLSRGEVNSASFDPDHGLDPFLDMHLINRITEISSPPVGDSLAASDMNPGLVSSQTIEIEARVLGRASELTASEPSEALQLSSTPARDQDEILNLLATTTIASFASGRVIVNQSGEDIFNTLGEAVGLDEVLINPVFQVESGAANVRNVGLQLELIKDLTRSLSVSSGIPLTETQPPRYGARYRLNPQTLLRLSTDLETNESATIDFGMRF